LDIQIDLWRYNDSEDALELESRWPILQQKKLSALYLHLLNSYFEYQSLLALIGGFTSSFLWLQIVLSVAWDLFCNISRCG
jgi:hypothetical protein